MTASLHEFRVEISDEEIEDLRRRLRATRWPDDETVEDWSQGVPRNYVQELCAYWVDEYDMRRVEGRLNAFPQYRTEIDGLDIHFLHVRSPRADATPLIMTHGWPGSVVEFLNVLGPLTDPAAHGGDAADAFHVVVPSLPGYGFSGKPSSPGTGIERIAATWDALMSRLGYDRYFAQGGDWGALVTCEMAMLAPDGLKGIHLNVALASPEALAQLGEPSEEEQDQLAKLAHYLEHEAGYSTQQSTRPQTLAYGLADSPAGQCAWIVEKFFSWADCDGHPENAVSRDELLDNVMVYWLANAAASSARLYWESFKKAMATFDEIAVPSAYSLFPRETVAISERWLRTRFSGLRSYSRAPRGGHFAALEQPGIFVDEVRNGLRLVWN